jgi:hypothetical protein
MEALAHAVNSLNLTISEKVKKDDNDIIQNNNNNSANVSSDTLQ